MKHLSKWVLSLCMALAVPAQAMNYMQPRDQAQAQGSDTVYGYELMTPRERSEYQTRMRSMKTDQERDAFRLEHHRQMQARAKAQGKTLPGSPPADRGPGKGPGGGGMGPGYGR